MLYRHCRKRTALTVQSAPTALIFSRLFELGAVASLAWLPDLLGMHGLIYIVCIALVWHVRRRPKTETADAHTGV